MTPERWQQVKDLFVRASALERAERDACLDAACAGDTQLRAEVASLLRADATREAILDRPVTHYVPLSALDEPEEHWIGRRLGAYELIARLGSGGMGEVYRARRADEEYHKEVAIKLVRWGYDTAFVLQRFRAERQILANLDHPNIARLLDGGVSEAGQPYLVMELVDGLPIDEFCERHALTLEARLRLFREACAAVSYAHQHLVVHRDLKPSNVLVTAEGTIKLLDFGIAKLLAASSTATPADATRTIMRALTPGFCSPEQLLGLNITTASDVYSLGVLLFHLITGGSPYREPLNTTRAAIEQVCESEPLRPSAAVAAQMKGGGVERPLPDRDLDDITLCALRKEPERRYSSVEQFSEDLRRYLTALPVMARGEGFGYRAGKLLRRYRVPAAAAALVAVALLAGMAVATREMRIAEAQRARAERHFASVRALANSFMFQMHDALRDLPGATGARELLVRTALEYLDTLSHEAASDPHMQRELAQAYQEVADIQGEVNESNTGNPRAALASYSKAIALLEHLAELAPGDAGITAQLAGARLSHGRLLAVSGDTRAGAAESQRALAAYAALAAARPQDAAARAALAIAYTRHADTLGLAGDAAALGSAERAIAILEPLQRAAPADEDYALHLAVAYNRAGYLAQLHGDDRASIDRAIERNQQALQLVQRLLQSNPSHERRYGDVLASAQADLGVEYFDRGEHERALEYYRAAAATLAHAAADRDDWQAQFDLANVKVQIGDALRVLGRPDAAEAELREAEGSMQQLAARGDTLALQFVLASCQRMLGDLQAQRAGATDAGRATQLLHWRAAQRWYASAVQRYQRVAAGGIALFPLDRKAAEDAAAALTTSEAAIERLEGAASVTHVALDPGRP